MKTYKDVFSRITSLENIVAAWEEFRIGKRHKADVQAFEFSLEENLFLLQRELQHQTYRHGPYFGFYLRDPKVRHVHKAMVRDRVLHHAVFRVLNPMFEPTFIANSFSCRTNKGAHRGVLAVERMIRQESRNYATPCFVLKCDVKKFFDSVDHTILLTLLWQRILDSRAGWLLEKIVHSYHTPIERE